MGLVSGYTNDVFISYSHIDNEPFGDPRGGWVDIFHEQLQNFVNVHLGRRTQVCRDTPLSGAEVFSDESDQQLRSSAMLTAAVQQRTDAPRGNPVASASVFVASWPTCPAADDDHPDRRMN